MRQALGHYERSNMRILFLTQFYPPEIGAAQNRISDLAGRLAESDNIVTVLTALPSYPKGEVFEGYRGRFLVKDIEGGLRVLRVWSFTTKSKSFLPRLISYLSFALDAFLAGIWEAGRQDIIFVEMPPLFLGISGWLLSACLRSYLVINVSDLWPESAIALGVLRNRLLIRAATCLEEALYSKADFLTGQTQGIVDSIRSRGGGKHVELMPNGVNPEFLLSGSMKSGIRSRIQAEFGLSGKFVVGYTGLHGLAQGLSTVLEAAEILREHKDVVFAFFGDGPEKDSLRQVAVDKSLYNVRFFPVQPVSRMPEVFTALDVALIPLKNNVLFHGALPSKLFEAMGAGVPVIVAIEGEARDLVQRSQCGLLVPPENAAEIADAILRLQADPKLCLSLGENGRTFVLRHHNRKDTAQKFRSLVMDRLELPRETKSHP